MYDKSTHPMVRLVLGALLDNEVVCLPYVEGYAPLDDSVLRVKDNMICELSIHLDEVKRGPLIVHPMGKNYVKIGLPSLIQMLPDQPIFDVCIYPYTHALTSYMMSYAKKKNETVKENEVSDWIHEHIHEGAKVMSEYFDVDLLLMEEMIVRYGQIQKHVVTGYVIDETIHLESPISDACLVFVLRVKK